MIGTIGEAGDAGQFSLAGAVQGTRQVRHDHFYRDHGRTIPLFDHAQAIQCRGLRHVRNDTPRGETLGADHLGFAWAGIAVCHPVSF